MGKARTIGNIIAPPLFIRFFILLLAGVAVGTLFSPWWIGLMFGFNAASILFLAGCIAIFRHSDHDMRVAAEQNDANRVILLVLAFALSVVVLVAVGTQMLSDQRTTAPEIALIIFTLLMAWVFANTVYALHYAHLFYSRDSDSDRGGISFPGTPLPSFADFVYFSFTIGCTLAVSDTEVTSPHIRKVVTAHSVAGFVYNVGVVALTVNLLAGRS